MEDPSALLSCSVSGKPAWMDPIGLEQAVEGQRAAAVPFWEFAGCLKKMTAFSLNLCFFLFSFFFFFLVFLPFLGPLLRRMEVPRLGV